MNEELLIAVGVTAGIGAINLIIIRVMSQAWITPALCYWGAWLAVLLSYIYLQPFEALPEPREMTFKLLYGSHLGAFIAFPLGTMFGVAFAPRQLREARREGLVRVMKQNRERTKRYLEYFVYLLLVVALVVLVYRVVLVGGLSLSYLSSARDSFIGSDKSAIRWSFYIVVLYVPVAIMVGVLFAQGHSSRKVLFILGMALLFLSLAEASRQKPFIAFLFGIFSFLGTASGGRLREFWRRSRKFALRALVILVVLLTFFQTLRALRAQADFGGLSEVPVEILSYYALGFAALGPHAERVRSPETGGEAIFEDWLTWIHRFGLTHRPRALGQFDWKHFESRDPRIARCGVSQLGWLYLDYGEDGVWVAQLVLMFTTQFLFFVFVFRGLSGHSLAIHCMFNAFYTVYMPWMTSTAMILMLLWSLILSWFCLRGVVARGERAVVARGERAGLPP